MIGGEKILASREGGQKGRSGLGGIPPRPSVPPERSGGGQFRSKNVRAELYNSISEPQKSPGRGIFGFGVLFFFYASRNPD